jgi:hypothetical protein
MYLDYSPVNKAVHVLIHIWVLPANIRVYLDGLYVEYVYTHFAAVRNIFTYTLRSSKYITQQCTNPRRSVAAATNFCTIRQVLCMELAARHRSGAWSFEVDPIFGNIFVPVHYTHFFTCSISNGSCLLSERYKYRAKQYKVQFVIFDLQSILRVLVIRPRGQRLRL